MSWAENKKEDEYFGSFPLVSSTQVAFIIIGTGSFILSSTGDELIQFLPRKSSSNTESDSIVLENPQIESLMENPLPRTIIFE